MTKKKSILFLITDLEGGGAEKALIELLKRFDYDRYDVTLCLMNKAGVYLNDVPKSVRLVAMSRNTSSFFFRKTMKYSRKKNNPTYLSWFIKRQIKKRYDIIISFMEGNPLFMHSMIFDRADRNISWIHCDPLLDRGGAGCFTSKMTEQEAYEVMDSIVFVSRITRSNFEQVYQNNVPKHALYNIIDRAEIIKAAGNNSPKQGIFTIIAIGSLTPVKCFDRLIRVAKMLKDNGYKFHVQIVGEGLLREELTSLRDQLGLTEEVEITGFIKSPYARIKQSNLLISTSLAESLSYVITEALTLGVPVVATRTAGSTELLGGGEAIGKFGVITEHDDNSIYAAIKELIDNPELIKKYSALGLERAETFREELIMQGVYDIIENRSNAPQ